MSPIVQLQPHPFQLPGGLNRWDIDPLRHGPMDPWTRGCPLRMISCPHQCWKQRLMNMEILGLPCFYRPSKRHKVKTIGFPTYWSIQTVGCFLVFSWQSFLQILLAQRVEPLKVEVKGESYPFFPLQISLVIFVFNILLVTYILLCFATSQKT